MVHAPVKQDPIECGRWYLTYPTLGCLLLFLSMSTTGDTAISDHPVPQTLILENGLQFVWEEDHRQSLVAIEAHIKGGLRAEGRYLGTGITHFIEHMLFKGTPSRPPGTIEQELRRYGGTINAYTSLDTTGITLFVEERYFKEALALLADLLQHAQFDATEFEKERAVIISEIQMNLDDPHRRIHRLFWERHLLEHPYRYPILGYQSLLEQLSVKELTDFYHTQYQPQNIVISCVGDIQGSELPSLAKEFFETWPRGTLDPLQSIVAVEPETASAKSIAIEMPIQSAYGIVGWSSTRLSDPDLYALDVLASILGKGTSSRLYEQLVRQKQLVSAISAWNYTPYDPGIFAIQMRTDPDKVDDAIWAILDIVEKVKQKGITETELRKAKRQVSAEYWFGLQTVESKAADLANSLAQTGDPQFSRRYVEGIQQVSAQRVQEVARRYCDRMKLTTAIIRPQAAPPIENRNVSMPSSSPIALTRTSLKNGATLLVGVDHTLPIVGIVAAFRGGLRVETEETQGLSNLVAQMLTKGTTRQTASQIAQRVESLGASLESFSGRDGFGLAMQLLAEDVDEGLILMHELINDSIFSEDELAIQRQLITKQITAEEDEIFAVGGKLLRRTLFREHPYRFDPLGERETIVRLTKARCMAFAKEWLAPSNMVLAVFGDIPEQKVKQDLTRSFGAEKATPSLWPERLPQEIPQEIQEISQVMDREQALVFLGFHATTYKSPERYALDVLTSILSGMAGRLFQAVREKYGLSYTLGAVHVPGWDPGYLLVYAATKPSEETRVLSVLEEQLKLICAEGVTEEELDQAKRYLIGQHRLDLQHLLGLAKRSVLDELYGLGFDAWQDYEQEISAVSAPMVQTVAQQYLVLEKRSQVIISPNTHAD